MSKIKITVSENVRRNVTWEIEANDLPYADWQAVERLGNLLEGSKRIHHAVDPELGEALIRVLREHGRITGVHTTLADTHDRTYGKEGA